MLRLLVSIVILSILVSVQALSAVCKVKCSLPEFAETTSQKGSQESHESCHSQTEEENQSNSDDCGDICNADDLFSDSKVWEIEKSIQDSNYFAAKLIETINFIDRELAYNISTHDPPGISFFAGVPVYIQKSSYLI
jgi:hypothetical protein